MKYNVFDKDGKYLGTIHGDSPEDAVEEAKIFGMPQADHVVLTEDRLKHHRRTKRDYLN